jgi:enterochelin esterase-like enzyme
MTFNLMRPILFAALLCISIVTTAQPPRGPFIASPEIHKDKTVTFRYLAPQANIVRLSGQFQSAPVDMKKDSIGIWSVTIGPIKPDIYPYSFIVDGVNVMDPSNVDLFPNEKFKASLVDVPGDEPLVHALKDVPHGSVSYEYYKAPDGTIGSLVIYTPPGYDQQASKRYPAFYLISGTTDTEETWFKVGRTNLILDNLLAEGKVKPMIIVMPYGNVAARHALQSGEVRPADPTTRDGDDAVKRAKAFEDDLVKGVIPFVEKKYRVIADRENRAIGGFSRGGGQTLRTAFNNMDKFAWICCYAANLSPQEMERSYKAIYEKPEVTNKQLKLFWISVGSDDFLYKSTVEFMDFLKAKNVNYKSLVNDGGHTWMNTKKYLAATTQLLFK